MENLMLTEEQIKGLKSYVWEKNHNTDTFFIGGISIECFTDYTGYDLAKLQELKPDNVSMGWELEYGKPDTDAKHPTTYYLHSIVYIDNKIFNEKYFVSDVDFLGLYTKEEEKTGTDWQNLLSNVLENALKETDADSIVEFIDNNFAEISNKIRENFSENLEVDDIGECLKSDIVQEYIEENASGILNDVWDRADSYDIKDKIIDYLSDNL